MARKRTPVKFEDALEELEKLVEKLETGELTLEDSLQIYERGIALSRDCTQALDQAEQRVRVLGEGDAQSTAEPPAPDKS